MWRQHGETGSAKIHPTSPDKRPDGSAGLAGLLELL